MDYEPRLRARTKVIRRYQALQFSHGLRPLLGNINASSMDVPENVFYNDFDISQIMCGKLFYQHGLHNLCQTCLGQFNPIVPSVPINETLVLKFVKKIGLKPNLCQNRIIIFRKYCTFVLTYILVHINLRLCLFITMFMINIKIIEYLG